MDNLHWPLSVLSRAIHFKNLTGASSHVGLSQPQLSRLISQLEKELNVVLLDRSAKRKSSWTPAAFRLADIYSQNSRRLQSSIHEILEAQIPTLVNIGTLEGLSGIALEVAHHLLSETKVNAVELDVFDQNDLEEKFFNGDLDVIVTSRLPSKQKYTHVLEVGYQTLDHVQTNEKFQVMSPYEYGKLKKKSELQTLVSNSLALRKTWLDKYGGRGIIPSVVQKGRGRDVLPVHILATELFCDPLWQAIKKVADRL